MRGKFITLEGGEGAGKSTQAKRLADRLRADGKKVTLTREVGGCEQAEEIRKIWLGKGEGYWDSVSEVFLISTARREHLVKTIWPALQRGEWVVCDRFVDSTRAYQGVGLGLGLNLVNDLSRHATGGFEPDLTLLLDLPVGEGLERMASRGGEDDRYQQKNFIFHETLRDAYLDLACNNPHRFAIIDAAQNLDLVADAIYNSTKERLR